MLKKFFEYYSRPRRIITDRATCFTGIEFENFLKENNVEHIRNATASPQANVQIKRINRVLTPMIEKLSEVKNQNNWSQILTQVEYALNNSSSTTTQVAPSVLLFGVRQRGVIVDWLSEYLEDKQTKEQVNLLNVRTSADAAIRLSQLKSLDRHNKIVAPAKVYNEGDFVVIRNIDTTVGKCKKLVPKYKGLYIVHKSLPNDRYVIKDIENCQITQMPYNGIIESARMKKWIQL